MWLNGKHFKNIHKNSLRAVLRERGYSESDLDLIDLESMDEFNSIEDLKDYLREEYGIIPRSDCLSGEKIECLNEKWDAQLKEWEAQNQELIDEWVEKVELPPNGVVIITGARGSGKSALGYYFLELAHAQGRKTAVFGLPVQKKHLLPPHISLVEDINCLPENAAIFLDESALNFYSRDALKKTNKLINRLVSICRQRDQLLVFVTHNLRKLDIGIVIDSDAILFKKPSLLHSNFERAEIREITRKAAKELENRGKEFVYCYTSDYEGLLKNPLPYFWSEELSKAWASIPIVPLEASEEEQSIKKALEKIEKFEKDHEKEFKDFEEKYKIEAGWEWFNVNIHPSILNKLVVQGKLKIVSKSNKRTLYRLA